MPACATVMHCSKGLETPHFTLHSSHFTLHSSHLHFTLHTSSHLVSSDLFSPHLSSSPLISSHLISSLLTCHLSSSQLLNLSTAQPFSSHRSSPQLILALLHVTKLVLLPERSLLHTKVNGQRSFCTQKFETQMRLHGKAFTHRKLLHMRSVYTQHAFTHTQHFFYTQPAGTHRKLLHKELLHTAGFYTQHTFTQSFYTQHFFTQKSFCTQQLLHRESSTRSKLLHRQAFRDRLVYTRKFLHREAFTHRSSYTQKFLRTGLRKAFPSAALYYKACTKYFPVLLCTTKFARSTSQYFCVLQNLHKVGPSIPLCSTKLAPSTSQYYFILHSLHKVLPSTTSDYKACTK